MKKHLSLSLFSLLLLMFFFTACGSQAATTKQVNDNQENTQTSAVKVHSGGGCFYRDGELASHADLGQTYDPPRWQVGNSPFFGAKFDSCRDVIHLSWSGSGFDFYQVRWSRPGLSEQQFSTSNQNGIDFTNAHFNTIYTFYAQGCVSHWYGSSCSDWSPTIRVATYYPGYCHVGYVWREAGPSDYVCVTPATRSQAAYDNSQRYNRVDPNGGPYGPDTCLQGYVWREAFSGDHVCVTPATRSQAAYDNAHAYDRTYH